MQLHSEWSFVPAPDAETVQTIAHELRVSPVTASLLASRGYGTVSAARTFLHADLTALHDWDLLPDLTAAVARIDRALDSGECIGIYGDYDVDGQTGTALLVRGLTALGAEPKWYIPERVGEGYGLNEQAIEALANEGVQLLITVDCGSGAVEETTRARQLGMDVIVTDHHEPGEESLPVVAFINPKRDDCAYPFRELAGVGVAWKLMQALWRARGRTGYSPHGLEYAALGTVADVCPLVDENRIFVREGLALINAGTMPALSALAEVSGVKRGEVDATRIAFGLAPRLNAAGRVGHAELGVRLLLTDDGDEALALARELDEENMRRRQIEAEIVEEAIAKVEEGNLLTDWVIVVAGEGWHPGVIGIVASRLVERYARPAIVIGLDGDVGTGSGRSISAFDLHAGLSACAAELVRYGGHRMAAGLTVHRDHIDALKEALNAYAGTVLTAADLVPGTRIDIGLSLDEVTEHLAQELEQLAPFGAGNPTPVLAAEDVLVMSARAVGRQSDHLKMTLKDQGSDRVHEAMAFGSGALVDTVTPGSEVHVAFGLRLGEWRGRPQLTLALRALQLPLAVAEREAARGGAPVTIAVPTGRSGRGKDVLVADRRDEAPVHPLARVAYLRPLAQTGARIVAVVGPGDDVASLAGSVGHTMHVDARMIQTGADLLPVPSDRVSIVTSGVDFTQTGGGGSPDEPPAGWEGRGHLVLFGLPIAQHVLCSLLVLAATPGWTVHLAYDGPGVDASTAALARAFPDRDALRLVYRALQSPALRTGDRLPSPERIATFIEAKRRGLVDTAGVEHGLAVFEQLGLVRHDAGGLRLVPQHGRKVDVDTSDRYNNGIKIQQNFAALSRIALEASPAALFAWAAERSPRDGFAFPNSGSA